MEQRCPHTAVVWLFRMALLRHRRTRALRSHPVLAGDERNSSRDPTFGYCCLFCFKLLDTLLLGGRGSPPAYQAAGAGADRAQAAHASRPCPGMLPVPDPALKPPMEGWGGRAAQAKQLVREVLHYTPLHRKRLTVRFLGSAGRWEAAPPSRGG